MVQLSQTLGAQEKLDVVHAFFNEHYSSSDLDEYAEYFEHYNQELILLRFGLKEQWRLLALPIKTHEDIINVARMLSNNRNLSLRELCDKLRTERDMYDCSFQDLRESIELVIRMWLTMNIRNELPGVVMTGIPPLMWRDEDSSLHDFVVSHFVRPSPNANTNIRLDPHFTIAYISQACGLEVQWTRCLADHLWMDPLRKTIHVYAFKRCLADQLLASGSIAAGSSPIIPADLLQETIWTLNLLFPAYDKRTMSFLRKCQPPKTFHFSRTPDDHRPLDLDTYVIWRGRLRELFEFYKRGPSTLKQAIRYQKPFEKVNLFIAVVSGFLLALVFGTISSITAIMSLRASLEALEVARQTYLLQAQVPICPCS